MGSICSFFTKNPAFSHDAGGARNRRQRAVPELVAPFMGKWECPFRLPNAGQFARQVHDLVRNQMHDLTLALDAACDGDHRFGAGNDPGFARSVRRKATGSRRRDRPVCVVVDHLAACYHGPLSDGGVSDFGPAEEPVHLGGRLQIAVGMAFAAETKLVDGGAVAVRPPAARLARARGDPGAGENAVAWRGLPLASCCSCGAAIRAGR